MNPFGGVGLVPMGQGGPVSALVEFRHQPEQRREQDAEKHTGCDPEVETESGALDPNIAGQLAQKRN